MFGVKNKTWIFVIALSLILNACYSFTGGSIPEHLKTLQIVNVIDNSNYGNPIYKDDLTLKISNRFRNDNSFSLVNYPGDAKLTVTISGITEEPASIKASNEIETERKITVRCNVEYFDNVKKKKILDKQFSASDLYQLSNPQESRNVAISKILDQVSDDILLAVVSGW